MSDSWEIQHPKPVIQLFIAGASLAPAIQNHEILRTPYPITGKLRLIREREKGDELIRKGLTSNSIAIGLGVWGAWGCREIVPECSSYFGALHSYRHSTPLKYFHTLKFCYANGGNMLSRHYIYRLKHLEVKIESSTISHHSDVYREVVSHLSGYSNIRLCSQS